MPGSNSEQEFKEITAGILEACWHGARNGKGDMREYQASINAAHKKALRTARREELQKLWHFKKGEIVSEHRAHNGSDWKARDSINSATLTLIEELCGEMEGERTFQSIARDQLRAEILSKAKGLK